MKRIFRSAVALLLILTFLVGCSANEKAISEAIGVESSEIIVDESSMPEAEESIEDKFAGIASFDTEFNEENVHYYDGYMTYWDIYVVREYMYRTYSRGSFDAYESAEDDDWFVVGLSCSDEQREIIEHIGAIEIPDHPFAQCDAWLKKIEAAKNEEERQELLKEQHLSYFPGSDYKNDPAAGLFVYFNYVGYFTKPMLQELSKAVDGTSLSYTFMPEVGNNECWFKTLRKS